MNGYQHPGVESPSQGEASYPELTKLDIADLRQCTMHDSGHRDASLVDVEYMTPKHVSEILDPEEQQLWQSHESEVSSFMLVVVQPSSEPSTVRISGSK